MSHSPFDSCIASLEVLVTLFSCKSRCAGCAVTSTDVFGSSKPTARMLIVYWPGSSLCLGKLYWPWALLTTQVVIGEPAFFAPTRTPSIAPSACDVTLPVKAEGDGFCASTRPTKTATNTVVPAAKVARCITRLTRNLLSQVVLYGALRMPPPAYCGNAFQHFFVSHSSMES